MGVDNGGVEGGPGASPGASEARGQVLHQLRRDAGMGQGERVPMGLQHWAHVAAVLLLSAWRAALLPRRAVLLPRLCLCTSLPLQQRDETEGAHALRGRVVIETSTQPSLNRKGRVCASVRAFLPKVSHTLRSIRGCVLNDPPAR